MMGMCRQKQGNSIDCAGEEELVWRTGGTYLGPILEHRKLRQASVGLKSLAGMEADLDMSLPEHKIQ